MSLFRDYVKRLRLCVETGKNRMNDIDTEDFLIWIYLYSVRELSQIMDEVQPYLKNLTQSQQDFFADQFAETCYSLVSIARENSLKLGGRMYDRFSKDLSPTTTIDTTEKLKSIVLSILKDMEIFKPPGGYINTPNEIQ